MGFDELALVGEQRAGLPQHLAGHVALADVVQERRPAERDQALSGDPEPPPQRDGQLRDAGPVCDQPRIRGRELIDQLPRALVAAAGERCGDGGGGGIGRIREACKRIHAA